jgi:RNA polymerase sigma factor (sigma-70 family)
MDAGVKALYDTTAQPMLRFFVYRGTSGDEAKDILQETFIKIIRSAGSYSGQGEAKSWIWQIARNCLIDHQRKQGSLANHETAVNEEQWESLAQTTPDPNATSCVVPGSGAHSIIRNKLSLELIVIEGHHRHTSAPGCQQKFNSPHAAKRSGFTRTQAADLEQFQRQHKLGLTSQRRGRDARRSQRIQRKFKRHGVHNSALQVSAEALFLIMAQAVIP